jgi:hypothetical protein
MKLYAPPNTDHSIEFQFYGRVKTYFKSHFLLDADKWVFVNNLQDADIVFVHPNEFVHGVNGINDFSELLDENQILVVMLLESSVAISKDTIGKISNKHKKTIFISTDAGGNDLQYIFYDIMFNRHKLFYTDYTDSLKTHFWSKGVKKEAFSLAEIRKSHTSNTRLFLIPNRIRYDRQYFHNDIKIKLDSFLKTTLSETTYYYGNPFAVNGTYLRANGYFNQVLPDHIKHIPWVPIANYYYNNSYVSVCIESHCDTPTDFDTFFSPSEKYFDPLIKGNFPLIFSSPFTISNLKKYYGFKFPDWIDYSYDNVINFDDRLNAYFNSIRKVATLSVTEVHDLYLRDKHILDYNRNVFFAKSYDSLYDKIQKNLKKLNWLH